MERKSDVSSRKQRALLPRTFVHLVLRDIVIKMENVTLASPKVQSLLDCPPLNIIVKKVHCYKPECIEKVKIWVT